MKTIKLIYLVLFVALFVGGCSKEEVVKKEPVVTENMKVADNVIHVDVYNLRLVSSDADLARGVYRYQITGTSVPTPKIGDILLSSVKAGYIRKVTSITQTNREIVANTTPADLGELFETGTIDLNFNMQTGGWGGRTEGLFESVELVSEGSAQGVTSKDKINYELEHSLAAGYTLSGNVVANPNVAFKMTFAKRKLSYVKFAIQNSSIAINPKLTIDVKSKAATSLSKDLAHLKKRFVFWAGAIPIVMQVRLTLIGTLAAQFDQNLSTTIAYSGKTNINFGSEYSDGIINPIKNITVESGITTTPNVNASGMVRLYVIPQIDIEFYDAITGILKPKPYVELFSKGSASATQANICAELNTGIDMSFGANGNFLGIDLFNYHSSEIQGPVTNIWKSNPNCKNERLVISNPTYTKIPTTCIGWDDSHKFNINYAYSPTKNSLKLPATATYIWRSEEGTSGSYTEQINKNDVSLSSFSTTDCTIWGKSNYFEVSTYVTDAENNKSNIATFLTTK